MVKYLFPVNVEYDINFPRYVEYEEEENFDEFASAAENTSGLRKKFEEVR